MSSSGKEGELSPCYGVREIKNIPDLEAPGTAKASDFERAKE